MILGCEKLEGRTGHEAGRQLLKRLWAENVGGEMPEIAVSDRGKPYFTEGGWHFSISHTRRRVFCALSRENIGIDAEELDRDINPALADKILSRDEMRAYERAGDKRLALLRFWVLKEADAKRSGEGLRGYPNHTCFSPEDPRVSEMEGCLVAVLTDA